MTSLESPQWCFPSPSPTTRRSASSVLACARYGASGSVLCLGGCRGRRLATAAASGQRPWRTAIAAIVLVVAIGRPLPRERSRSIDSLPGQTRECWPRGGSALILRRRRLMPRRAGCGFVERIRPCGSAAAFDKWPGFIADQAVRDLCGSGRGAGLITSMANQQPAEIGQAPRTVRRVATFRVFRPTSLMRSDQRDAFYVHART